MSEIGQFLDALTSGLADDEFLGIQAFSGDPADTVHSNWRCFPALKIDGRWRIKGNPEYNRYVTVAAFRLNERKDFVRQKQTFSAACALMIDDVGEEVGGAVKLAVKDLQGLPPSAVIETSKNNFQYWYFFTEPLRDMQVFDKLISEFIRVKLAGVDSGMAGVTRVGRTPDSTNGKQKAKNWKVQMPIFNPEVRYTPNQLAAVFGLDLSYIKYQKKPRSMQADHSGRIANFERLLQLINLWGLNREGKTGLDRRGSIDETEFNYNGWMPITCPWLDAHSTGATGTAIQLPREANMFLGGFQCHHSECRDKTLAHLSQWISEQLNDDYMDEIVLLLDKANRRDLYGQSKFQ